MASRPAAGRDSSECAAPAAPAQPELPVLRTARLILRPRTLANADASFAMDREPGTLDWVDWYGETGSWDDEAAHRAFIEARILGPYPPGLGYWVIAPHEYPEEFLGWVLLIPEDAKGPDIEIGWRLVHKARREGYATEAARAVLDHGFRTVGLDRVEADMYRANAASMGVARKLGMHQVEDPERTNERYVLWEATRQDWCG